jgi:PKD repeat protein
VTASTSYSSAGTFQVTLTVTDDAGSQFTITQSVTVSQTGTLAARLTVSPTTGIRNQTVFFFDASASQPGPNPIVEYRFTFGDASPDVVGTSPTTSRTYSRSGTFNARVTVRDSAGRTSTADVSVTVTEPAPPTNTTARGPLRVAPPK